MANSTPVMKKAQEYPLYSLVIQAYKQEKYIRQTLKGAFDQTYPNLEIIVCDDASPDHTWEIIEEEVRNYKGPHKIILHKNAENLGIAGAASLVVAVPACCVSGRVADICGTVRVYGRSVKSPLCRRNTGGCRISCPEMRNGNSCAVATVAMTVANMNVANCFIGCCKCR